MGSNRNDLCFCGSGKIYKQCCINNNVVSLDNIRKGELNKIQYELLDFAVHYYGEALAEIIDHIINDEFLDDDEEEIITFMLTIWSIFSFTIDNEKKIIDYFIDKKKREKSIKASTLDQLMNWNDIFPSICKIIKVANEQEIEVQNIFTDEKVSIKLTSKDGVIEEGGLILGFLVPYGEYYSYFTFFLDFEAAETSKLINEIFELYKFHEYENHFIFMRELFPEILTSVIMGTVSNGQGREKVNWRNPMYEKVIACFQAKIEEEKLPEQFAQIGIIFWHLYCNKQKPTIRKPEIYAAALHYFVDVHMPVSSLYTQVQISNIYRIHSTALLNAYRKMKENLVEEMKMMTYFLEDKQLSHDKFTLLESKLLPFIPRKK